MKLTLCIDRQSRVTPSTDLREYQIDIGCPLRSYEDVYDELKIATDDNKKLIGTIIRRCEVDKYGVLKKLEKEKIQELVLPGIALFEGDNYVYIKEYNDLNMKIQYLTNAEMNKYFATKMELNSTIKQTMDNILLEVSKKADNEQVSAMIKLLVDEINLKVTSDEIIASINTAIKDGQGIIEIVGNRLIIVTDYVQLTENGKFNCTGGKIANFEIVDNKLTTPVYLKYDYNSNDLTKIKNYIMGTTQLTNEEIQKYDVTSDGIVNSWDYAVIGNVIKSGISKNKPGKFEIDATSNALNVLNFYDSNNLLKYYIGYWVTKLNNFEAEYIQSNGDIHSSGVITAGENRCITSPYVNWLNFVNTGSSNYMEINLYNPFADVSSFGVNVWASDKRLKNSIKDTKVNALDIIKKIKHREFKYNNNDNLVKIGYVADELQKIDKEMIFEVGKDKLKQPNESYIIPLLSKGIQEQQKIIEQLKERLEVLENGR